MNTIIIDFFLLFIPIAYYYLKADKNESEKRKFIKVLEELKLTKINKKILLNALILLFFLLFASISLQQILNIVNLNDLEKVNNLIIQIKGNLLVLVYLITVRPIAEEIFFRGFLTQKTGLLFSSIFFALAHMFYYSIAEIIGAFVLGLILAYFYLKTKNLYPNILSHIGYNLIIISLI